MENKEGTVVLVLGHMHHLFPPTHDMRVLLWNAIDFVLSDEQPHCVIACGGITNHQRFPEKSEASVIADFFRSRSVQCPIFLEEKSRTTRENLFFAKHILEQQGIIPKTLVIFCERSRSIKILFFARRIFGGNIILKKNRLRTKAIFFFLQLCVVTPLEILAYYFPPLEWAKTLIRKWQIQKS